MQHLQSIGSGLTHLLYPHLCEGCGHQLVGNEEVLCLRCEALLPETNYHLRPDNDTNLRFAGRVPFEKATSYAWFTPEGLLQHLLHGLKYRKRQQIGTYLGKQLGRQLLATGWAAGIDLLVPVPLHPKKEASRGYNQSYCIAQGISTITGIPVDTRLLQRKRETATQTNKTRAERVENMNNAFGIGYPIPTNVTHILIIDDVLTTGATIEACVQALLGNNTLKISIATIGIAVG